LIVLSWAANTPEDTTLVAIAAARAADDDICTNSRRLGCSVLVPLLLWLLVVMARLRFMNEG
jgi:hypothetical protein